MNTIILFTIHPDTFIVFNNQTFIDVNLFMDMQINQKRQMLIYMANPRGFCAGVDRAISIVDRALEVYKGKKIYVYHEIVHNKHVVSRFESMGVIFTENLDDVSDNSVLVLSAHGISEKIENTARKNKNIIVIDATCPLVKKVHFEAQKYDISGRQVILIGHAGHAEVKGTTGRIKSEMLLVEKIEDIKTLDVKDPNNLAYITQTTLSVDDTKDIIDTLRTTFPNIVGPKKEDICYATQNRQDAVKKLSEHSDILLVIGSKNSSNSNRLKELGEKMGVTSSYLIDSKDDIDLSWFNNVNSIGITAGASAPEILVERVIQFLKEHFIISIQDVIGAEENIKFRLPRELEPSIEDRE